MTCKDCMHYDACLSRISFMMDYDDINDMFIKDIEKRCNQFKDKSKYIELPCKVGDTVYVLDYEDDNAVDYSGYIFIMANNDFAFLSPVLNGESNPIEICNEYFQRSIDDEDNSGVIVPLTELFFTKSEAEQKLKELQND